jgi:hypothetical protein
MFESDLDKPTPQREWKEDVDFVEDRYGRPVRVGNFIAELVEYEHVIACRVLRTYIDHRNTIQGNPYDQPSVEYEYKSYGMLLKQSTWAEWCLALEPGVEYPLIDVQGEDFD